MKNEFYPYINLPLPYAYDALAPFIDEKTMMLHHDKHLQTYINNLNKALQEHPRLQKLSLEHLIKCSHRLPTELGNTIRNNAGGVFNHRFYFDLLANPSEQQPRGMLRAAIDCDFGGFEQFKESFKKAALSVFGSGYAWLVSGCGKLKIITTPNQDSPVACGLCPILTIDVWEHAYYLKHYNVRADYIEDYFKIINWTQAEMNYQCCGLPRLRQNKT